VWHERIHVFCIEFVKIHPWVLYLALVVGVKAMLSALGQNKGLGFNHAGDGTSTWLITRVCGEAPRML
jgi:hypothetical protein